MPFVQSTRMLPHLPHHGAPRPTTASSTRKVDDIRPHHSSTHADRYGVLDDAQSRYIVLALEMLGGHAVHTSPSQSLLEVHKWVIGGIPSESITHLAQSIHALTPPRLSKALGVSIRTLTRMKRHRSEPLSVALGGRAFKLAEVVARASFVLGTREAAVQWMIEPALGLGQRKPIDMLATPMGIQLVEEFLERIEHGVYA